MNLDSITAEIRPRESWEAADLGIALTRRDYGKILRAKMLVVWPLWGVLIFLLRDYFWLLAVGLWWTNAAWEKVTLYFISRRLFGSSEGIRTFLKDWPGWFWKRLPFSLFSGRFSGNRSLLLPAVMLEGINGSPLIRRATGLSQFSGMIGSKMSGIFFLSLHSLWLQITLLLYWLVPALSWRELTTLLNAGEPLPESFLWVCLLSYLLVVTFLTPFYVGAGFGMYINARTKMEGWDVELIFRRMAQRIAKAAIILFLGSMGLASAQEAPLKVERDPQKVIEQVLKDDAFIIHTKTEKRYVRKKDKDRDPTSGSHSSSGTPSRIRSGRGASSFGKGIDATSIGWIALAAVGCYLLILLARVIASNMKPSPSMDLPKIEKVMGMNVSERSIPKDLVTRAKELWEKGRTRDCLVLLYRGALSWLIHRGGVWIRESDTEVDCLDRTIESEGARIHAGYFRALTAAWIKVAYGKEELTEAEIRHLLENWPFEKKQSKALVTTMTSLLFVTLLSGCAGYEIREESREIGYKGLAKVYPFLAVEKFLEKMSVKFERIYTLTEMPSTESVILYPSEVDTRENRAVALLDWVEEGGSLVYLVEGTDYFTAWNQTNHISGKDDDEEETDIPNKKKTRHHLLDELGIKVGKPVNKENRITWGDKPYEWQMNRSRGLVVPKKMWNSASGYRVGTGRKSVSAIQLPYGKGTLTLVRQAKPWRNRYVGDKDHAAIFWEIVTRGEAKLDSVWLVRGSKSSFWELLKKYGWMPLLSCVIFILFWLWNSIPRFGPLIPDRSPGTRDFHEHLLMTGRFFVRQDMLRALIAPVRQRLKRKLKRFDLDGEEKSSEEWARLSEATGIPESSLRRAIETSEQPTKREYLQTIRVLQKIDQKL